MRHFLIVLSCWVLISCKKDTINTPEPEPPIPVQPKDYRVSFVFVNKIGFRNDSTRHGINDTVFQGPCLDLKFYDKKLNKTTLSNSCYNRNFPIDQLPVTDSILFRSIPSSLGNLYGYQIEMVWKCPTYPYTTKVLRYTTKNFVSGDTIKVIKDTIIKFIWPIDTASGKYIKTYQWP